jgi:integrase
MGRKNLKGAVSIDKDKNTIRLRWRYQSKRYSLNLFLYNKANLLRAKKISLSIENDFVSGAFDYTLNRYRELVLQASHLQPSESGVGSNPTKETARKEKLVEADASTSMLKEFDRYIAAKSMDPHSDDLSSYYTQTKAMLKKWDDFDPEDTPVLLRKEQFGPKTFNDRRNCLFKFFGWLVRKGKLSDNPLQEVSTRRRERNAEPRKPFTDQEVGLILDALKTDHYRKKSSRYSHSQYYPLVAFMIQTGVRNAEAIGLQVRDVLWESREIKICRALARTSKGTNEAARKEKGTKTNNVRFLPMNDFLADLLRPLCKGKQGTDLVFTNEMGRMIDDRMFQRRVFKPLLKDLKLQDRDLYACRHTFATRAVQAGLKAHEVAYLMGDNLQTVVNNYYHTERITSVLPNLSDRLMSLKPAG